ncbi:hypothetical protein BH10PSE6_BH10PSE6_38630 [soil metagenome]
MPIVRLYPVGEISPQPLPNAQPDVPAAGDINLFGGNQAQDLQVAGQRLGQASDSVFSIYERMAKDANDIRVQDFNNQYITGEREILRTGPDAYYKQSGADAIAGAGATIEKLTKLKDQIFGQAANGYQREKLRPILGTHFAVSADAVARHANDQQAAYGRTVASTAIRTSHADAVANPANLPNAMARVEGATRVLSEGEAPEVVESRVRTAATSVICAVINEQLGRNDPEGLALFQQYRDRLDPRERRVLGAAAETLTNTIAAADWLRDRSASLAVAPAPTGDAALDAVNVASASIAEPPPVTSWGGRLLQREGVAGHRERMTGIEDRRRALTALNEQEFAGHAVRLRANQTAIDTDTAWNRAAAKAEADKAYADLQRHMTTGGPGGGPAVTLPPPTVMSRFTDEQQDAVVAQANRTIEGKKTRTDPPTWYAIHQGLTGDDAGERERWADTNLVQFRGELSDEDFAASTKLQTTMRTNDGSAEATRQQAITRMSNRALLTAGIDPTPTQDRAPEGQTMQAATFRRALDDELSTFESSKGRPATAAEAQDIVDRLARTALNGGWLKVSNRNDSLTVASDIPSTDEAFHSDGAQVAQAEGSAESPPEQRQLMTIGVDFERLRRMREEEEQREAADQGPDGTVGSDGVHGTEPDPGSIEYRIADAQARDIVRAEDAEKAGGQGGGAPPTEPPPGSPEYRAAEAEARKLDEEAWNKLGFWRQMGVTFERFDEEGKKRGGALAADSAARRLATVLELQRRQDKGERLEVAEKQYLLKNRNVARDLAGAVGRIVNAQKNLDKLPMSDPLRRLFEASTVAEAGKLLREHPGEIAKALGIESLPALTLSLIAMAALGPVAGAITQIGTSGLDGYATGLIGALARAGVDVANADDLTRALKDKALMERVRKDATTDGAIAAGITAASMMIPVPRGPKRASKSLAMKVPQLNAKGIGFDSFSAFKNAIGHAPEGYAWHHIVGQTKANIERFGAKNIHNTNNLVLLPNGPGTIHNQITAHYGSEKKFSKPLLIRNWLAKQSFEEQAEFGRKVIDDFRKAMK